VKSTRWHKYIFLAMNYEVSSARYNQLKTIDADWTSYQIYTSTVSLLLVKIQSIRVSKVYVLLFYSFTSAFKEI
jgi:hypothetical protein